MSELEEAWEVALAEAKQRARGAGRERYRQVSRSAHEEHLLRRTAINWLTATFTSLAGEANRRGAGIQIERQEAHSFRRGSSTMVGSQLTLRRGVRTLSIESGWRESPSMDSCAATAWLAPTSNTLAGRARMLNSFWHLRQTDRHNG